MVRLGILSHLAVPGQLPAEAAQTGLQYFEDRQLPIR